MKKTKEVAVVIVLLVLLLVAVSVFAIQEPPQPVQDLRDFLLQPPDQIYRVYGYNEKTLILFNLVRLVEVCQIYEARISELEVQVKALSVVDTATVVIDPNE